MKKTTTNKTLILLATGLLVIAATAIFSRFLTITDFEKGSITGLGIGLLLTGLALGRFKTVK
jgi:hypothetical protein